MNTITIISVNVATPSVLGFADGEAVVSAIGKRPVGVASLSLSQLNLEGDEQADLRVHGGPDKAVYAYPSEHLGPWSEELGVELHPGAFGENLSLAGVVEDEVFIGDTWRWGNARLQVSQPRSPCFKLAMRLQRPEIIKWMIAGERTGWYLRVLRPGRVPVRGPIEVLGRDPLRLSVATAQRAAFGRERDSDALERLVRHPRALCGVADEGPRTVRACTSVVRSPRGLTDLRGSIAAMPAFRARGATVPPPRPTTRLTSRVERCDAKERGR